MRTLHLTNSQFAALYDILAETVEYIEGDLITTEDENGNEIAQQFAELVVDGMDIKTMEQYIFDNMMEYFSKLTADELEEEVYNHDEELWEELVDNVTNETVLDINNNGGKF